MRSTFILTALFLCFFQSASCQEADVTFSPEIKIERNADIHWIGKEANTYYGISARKLKIYAFDADSLKLKSEKALNAKEIKSTFDITYVVLREKYLYCFLSEVDIDYGKYNYYYVVYDLNGNETQSLTKLGGSVHLPSTRFGHTYAEELQPLYSWNRLSGELAVVTRFVNKGKMPDDYVTSVYTLANGKLETKWTNKFNLPFRDKDVEFAQVRLNEKNKVFALLNIRRTGEEKREKTDHFYELISVDFQNTKTFIVDLGKRNITSAYLKLNSAQNPMLVGLYRYGKTYSTDAFMGGRPDRLENADSLYQLTLDESSNEIRDLKFRYVPNLYPKGAEAERKLDYTIKNINGDSEGNTYIVGEQYALVIHSNQYGSSFFYYYKDIIVIKINKENNIDWVHRIPKNQLTINEDQYESYSILFGINQINFLYNEDPKNLSILEENETIENLAIRNLDAFGGRTKMKKSVAVLASVTTEGKVTKKLLFSNKDSDAILVPKRSVQLSETECLLYAEKGKTIRLGILKLK